VGSSPTSPNINTMFFVYILRSLKNGKSYVGVTGKEPQTRLGEHNIHSNKWTTQNGPFKLVYYESYYCKTDALHREYFFKSGIGKKLKEIIIKYYI
jgi:putative endonuclease